MSKLTGDTIKAGQRIWVEGYEGSSGSYISVPVELIVVDAAIQDNTKIQVALISKFAKTIKASQDLYEDITIMYLGDMGVRPYNYDSRPCQVFTTKEEMQEAIDSWQGENPNFLEEAA